MVRKPLSWEFRCGGKAGIDNKLKIGLFFYATHFSLHFGQMIRQSISSKADPKQVKPDTGTILSANLVECGTAKQTTPFEKLVWAFWRGRIHARRRVVYLPCSCSGEARLRRIDLIHEATSVCPARVVGMI